jgi:hypothetical protein
MAVYGGFGIWMLACPRSVQPEMFAVAVAVSALGWGLLRRRLEKHA